MLITLHSSLSVHFLCLCLSVSVCWCLCFVWCAWFVWCVSVLCGVCGCGVVVVRGLARRKNLRELIQNVPVCTGTTRTCVSTCGRGAGTHGDVLNLHTEVFWTDTRGRGGRGRRGGRGEGVTVSSAYQEKPTKSSHLAPQVHRRKPLDLTIQGLRKDSEQHVPESSNHSLYMMKLLSSSYPEGNCGGNQL